MSTACGSCGKDPAKSDTGSVTDDASAIPEFDAGSIHTEKLTPDVLLPVIQAIGFRGVVPKRVTIQFARNIIDGGGRAIADDTAFEISPETPGRLRFTSNSTLEFAPTAGFKPGEEYQVSLSQVESRKGPMIPPEPWTHSFKVPEFEFIGLSGAYLSEAAKQVEVDDAFLGSDRPHTAAGVRDVEVQRRADSERAVRARQRVSRGARVPEELTVRARWRPHRGRRVRLSVQRGDHRTRRQCDRAGRDRETGQSVYRAAQRGPGRLLHRGRL